MKTVKTNKVRLNVEEYLQVKGRQLKTDLTKQLERDIKPTFTVKSSFIDNEVLTTIDALVYIKDVTAPVRKTITIISLIEKGKTNIDAILGKVDKYLDEIPREVENRLFLPQD